MTVELFDHLEQTNDIDAYIAASTPKIASDEYHAWIYVERALELAETIKDSYSRFE